MERAEVCLSIVDPYLSASLQSALQGARIPWTSLPLGIRGWEEIRDRRPELLVVEVPEGSDGQNDLLQRLHRDRSTRAIPVVVYSRDLGLELRLGGIYQFIRDYAAVSLCVSTAREILGRGARAAGGVHRALLAAEDFRSLEDVIHLKTGITLKRERVRRLEEALREGMVRQDVPTVKEYVALLRLRETDDEEWRKLIPALTVEETSFFRTEDHFRALEEVAVPAILQRKRPGDPVRVWCAGCSTGEEAYSLAMSLRESIPDRLSYPIQIIATDINDRVLAVARQAAYSQRQVMKIPEPIRKKHFVQVGDSYFPEKSIRKAVVFKVFNLQSPAPDFRRLFPFPVDVIFCRNVVIYFRKVTIQRLVESFHSILADQGYLFLGYSETLYKFRHRFESLFWRDTFFYQKRSEVESQEEETPPPEEETPVAEETPPPLPPPEPDVDPYALLAAGDAAGAERAFASTADGGWKSLVGRAYACVRDGRVEAARALLGEIQKGGDLDPEGYYISGLIHQARGDRQMARQEYERALFLDPGFYPAQIQVAEILAAEQKREEAIRGFRAALESFPGSRIPYLVTLEGVFPSSRIPEILEGAIQEMEEMRS